jgi:hypothetical protein
MVIKANPKTRPVLRFALGKRQKSAIPVNSRRLSQKMTPLENPHGDILYDFLGFFNDKGIGCV